MSSFGNVGLRYLHWFLCSLSINSSSIMVVMYEYIIEEKTVVNLVVMNDTNIDEKT